MATPLRTVRVHQIPEKITQNEEKLFLRDLQAYFDSERPKIVLDCSRIESMDTATIRLLLSCLELVMKRNGDVRLAALDSADEASLRSAGIKRLFETYKTTAEAVNSFHQRPASVLPPAMGNEDIDSAEYAA
jgi:anti-anti-sigma factor